MIDSESGPCNHPNWRDGVRIGPVDEDRVIGFIPPFDREDRVYQGTAGEGVAVDADGNVYAAEGPNSLGPGGRRVHQVLRQVDTAGGCRQSRLSASLSATPHVSHPSRSGAFEHVLLAGRRRGVVTQVT